MKSCNCSYGYQNQKQKEGKELTTIGKLVLTNEHFLQPEFKNRESGLKVYIIYSKVFHNVISKEAKKHQKLCCWVEMTMSGEG